MRTARHPPELRVEDVMTSDVIAVGPETSIAGLIRLFLTHEIAGAPVIDAEGHAIGMVTTTDLLDVSRRSRQAGEPRYFRLWNGDVRSVGVSEEIPAYTQGVVRDVMSPAVLMIDRRATVNEAAQLMARAVVHRLVVSDGKRPCGILTAMDCLKVLIGSPS